MLSVRPSPLFKSRKTKQQKTMFATSVTMGLAEWIIDATCLVDIIFAIYLFFILHRKMVFWRGGFERRYAFLGVILLFDIMAQNYIFTRKLWINFSIFFVLCAHRVNQVYKRKTLIVQTFICYTFMYMSL